MLDLSTRKPELLIDFDRDKLRRYGLSTGMLANELRTSLFGKEISKFKIGEDDYKIQLRLDDKYRYDVDALMNKDINLNGECFASSLNNTFNTYYSLYPDVEKYSGSSGNFFTGNFKKGIYLPKDQSLPSLYLLGAIRNFELL